MAAASIRFELPQTWIAHVMQQESGGRTKLDGKPITSSAGAMGLMQIMPETYTELRQRFGFGANAYDPHDNIFAGTAYLHQLYVRYGYPNLFAAYHAGPSRLDDYLLRGRALPTVTMAYVAALTGARNAPLATTNAGGEVTSEPSESALFFVNHAGETLTSSAATSSSLFVPLTAARR